MAKVTITIEDLEDGKVQVHQEFDPPIDARSKDDLTPSQYIAGAVLVFVEEIMDGAGGELVERKVRVVGDADGEA